MNRCVLLVGSQLIDNQLLKRYILSNLQHITIDAIFEIKEHIKFISLLDDLPKNYDNIYIFCDKLIFTSMAKMLCSQIDDYLIYKDNILMPNKAKKITSDGFLIQIKNRDIALLQISSGEGFNEPIIDINKEIKECKIFQVFHNRDEVASIIKPLADIYNINYDIIQIVDSWCQLKIIKNIISEEDKFYNSLKELWDDNFIQTDDLLKTIIDKLNKNKLKITFAESCTGGLLASIFTDMPGVSSVFNGSVVSYSNGIKVSWLNVDKKNIVNYGVVSKESVYDMLNGILKASKSDVAVAISGIAGPSGGTKQKPVGTVVIGCKYKNNNIIEIKKFNGNREYIRFQSAYYALLLIYKIINKKDA